MERQGTVSRFSSKSKERFNILGYTLIRFLAETYRRSLTPMSYQSNQHETAAGDVSPDGPVFQSISSSNFSTETTCGTIFWLLLECTVCKKIAVFCPLSCK